MSEDRNCYLVYRRNFERRKDDAGRTEILACYANLRDANRRAGKEIKRIYQNADKDIAKPPKDSSREDRYASCIELNDKHVGIQRVMVSVRWIERQPKYDSDEDSLLGDDDEDVQDKPEPASQEPRPFPLPRGRSGCLNGLRFSIVRDQYPYKSSEIESLIKQYGGEF